MLKVQANHPERAYETTAIAVIPFLVLFLILRVLIKFFIYSKLRRSLVGVCILLLLWSGIVYWPAQVNLFQIWRWLLRSTFFAVTLLFIGYLSMKIIESKKSIILKFILFCLLFSPALFFPIQAWNSGKIDFPHYCQEKTYTRPGMPMIDWCYGVPGGNCPPPPAPPNITTTERICIWDNELIRVIFGRD
jgi:hypothetical protein